MPLLTVELSLGPEFDLRSDDADILIQIRGNDTLWQKERLLNAAIASLPEECSRVVWVDCDTVFARPDWADEVSDRLERVPLVQPFTRLRHLPRDVLPGEYPPTDSHFCQPALAAAVAEGQSASSCLGNAIERGPGTISSGMAWAARRELLARHGFYDACIIGGGDTALACAAYGCTDEVISKHAMNPMQQEYYLRWAGPFADDVRGRVGAVEGDILHLWHGDLGHRRSRARHAGLRPFEFDPAQDIAVDAAGCWRWNSDKPALHRYVREYFASRNEDGESDAAA